MSPVTFLRLRPAEHVNQLWAATRRRAGATTVEVDEMAAGDRHQALASRHRRLIDIDLAV